MRGFKVFVASVLLIAAYATDQIVDKYFSVQMAPALMFSNGPEQAMGQDFINSASLVVELGLSALALWLLYSAFHVKKASINPNQEGTVREEDPAR